MTDSQYRRRIELLATVTTWTEENPFRIGTVRRLESPGLAILGGLHAPLRTSEDRHVMADEDCVALMRDYPFAMASTVQEF